MILFLQIYFQGYEKLKFMKKIIYFLMLFLPLLVFANVDEEMLAEQNKILETTVNTLQNLMQLKEERDKTVQKALKELKSRGKEIYQEKTAESLEEMEADLELLEYKLESIATTVLVKDYKSKEPEKFELQKELENLLQPMLYSLKTITHDSRQIESYRQSIDKVGNKKKEADIAVDHLNRLLEYIESQKVSKSLANRDELHNTLKKMFARWKKEQEALEDELSTLDSQLKAILDSQESLLSSTSELFTDFFRSRGVNILLGFAAFFSVFALMRFFYDVYKKFRTDIDRIKSSFERLFNLVFLGASFFLSFIAMLFVFNLRNDWLLLGLGCLFLIAIGWVLIKSLPTVIDQSMLLLNLGSVREGERIIFNGIPWEVKSLSYYTHFVNPQLSGGSLHISVKELVGMVSRPISSNEEWFPSKEGDWVQLEDENIGKVVYQSPEMVQLVLFGGSHITYSAENYLSQNPMNLSRNYRIQMVFGIDYKYQSICTTEIQSRMCERLKKELEDLLGKNQLINVTTDFFSASSSSLDYEYEAYVQGSSAHMYEEVERVMVKSFADSCNKYGWMIPFKQITLHNAYGSESKK